MALRQDYYGPCAEEINRRITLLEEYVDEINKKKEHIGVDNADLKDTIIEKLENLEEIINDLIETLDGEKSRLVSTVG